MFIDVTFGSRYTVYFAGFLSLFLVGLKLSCVGPMFCVAAHAKRVGLGSF